MNRNVDNNSMALVAMEEQKQQEMLVNGLVTADKFINKNYLINLSQQSVLPIAPEEMNSSLIRLFKVERLVFDKEENINDKLISVYSALQSINTSVLLVLHGDGNSISFYIGIRAANPHVNSASEDSRIRNTDETAPLGSAATASKILESSFCGNFPGSVLRSQKTSEISDIMSRLVTSEAFNTPKNISCITVIPSARDEDKDNFVQGLEKFIDTMQNKKFSAVFIAKPVSKKELECRKRGYEELHTSLSPFAKVTLAYGENFSHAVSRGMFKNFSHTVNNSISNTTGTNSSTNRSQTYGSNSGSSINIGGFGSNSGTSSSTTSGYSSGTSWSKAVTSGTADTTAEGINEGDSDTTGNNRSLTVEHQNRSVSALMDKIDEQLKRISACEAYGVWECAAYFLSDDVQNSVVAANAYKALMLGDETHVENSFVNVWGLLRQDETVKVLQYLQYGLHPILEIPAEEEYTAQLVTPGNFISGKELPLLMGLPQKSVSGLTVSNIAEFGRNVLVQNKRDDSPKIEIGRIHHMGNTESVPVELDLNSLTAHCFVTGSTGSGKSNTTYQLIEKFMDNDIPFLVVEPAKGEYKDAFGKVEGLHVFTTNPAIGQMLKINPFYFAPRIHILEHLDRLIEIFNACWEMYAAMPAILKDAVERIYIEKGWDLLNSVYTGEGEPVYPTFRDLMQMLPRIIDNSGYSSDTKGDYTGALVTRVTSLTNGISGQIFCDCYDIPDSVLFDQSVVVDLSRVGSTETKSLIMGILVLRLTEYRIANANGSNAALRHVTILEEAHNLLKRTAEGQGGSNVVGKSVEMICNSIAEMRTYGEGFVIVDQSPTSVDIAAIKNTNTKILMRLPEKADCEAVGNAVGLNEEQIRELSKLGTGVAVVMQNNWIESVLTKIHPYSKKYEQELQPVSFAAMSVLKGNVLREFMNQYIVDRKMNIEPIREIISSAGVSSYKKEELLCCMEYAVARLKKGRDIGFFCDILLNVSSTRGLFDVMESVLRRTVIDDVQTYDYGSVYEWHEQIQKKLADYVKLPADYNYTIIKYLLYALEMSTSSADYSALREMLYT